jgi:MFS family permease
MLADNGGHGAATTARHRHGGAAAPNSARKDAMIEGMLATVRVRYGWVMVTAAALIMGMGFGAQVTVSVFITPLAAEFGWTRGDISFAYTLAATCAGLSGVLMGYLADRVSTRSLVLLGAAALGLAHVLLGQITERWQLYLLYGPLLGALAQGAFMAPLVTNVGLWFQRNKGLALGLAMAGQSLGAALVPLTARLLISEVGWRQAYHIMGLGAWCLLVPLAFFVRQPPLPAHGAAHGAATPGGTIGAARLTAILGAAIVCCCLCMSVAVVHVVPLAIDSGLSVTTAASILSVLMIFAIAGRVGVGKLADAIGGVRALLLASATETVLIFWFTQARSLPAFYVIAAIFAVGYGGVIPAYAVIVREYIPPGRVGRATGTVMLFGNIGMGLGGFLGGVLFDWSGSYLASFGAATAAGIANVAIVGTLLFHLRARMPLLVAAKA